MHPQPLQRCARFACVQFPVLAALVCLVCQIGPAKAESGPTVRDVIEFTRIVHPRDQDEELLKQQIAPDGKHAFIVTRRGDVRADLTHYEILLLDLERAHLEAGRPDAPRRILKIEASRDINYLVPSIQEPGWFGNRTLVFRARIKGAPFQVFKLDIITRSLTQLTSDTRGVASFAISADFRRVVYSAPVPNPPMPPGHHSVVVGSNSFWSIKFGQTDLRAQKRRYRFLVVDTRSRAPARPLGDSVPEIGYWPRISISPDGRWALLPVPAPERQLAWAEEYPFVKDATTKYGPAAAMDPLGYFIGPGGWVPRRMVAYRLSDGHAQVAVDAPDDAMGGSGQQRSDRLWQSGGESVLIAGTLLPAHPVSSGVPPDTSYIIEYWPDSQGWKIVAALNGRLDAAYPIHGLREGFVAIDDNVRRSFFRRPDGTWQEEHPAAPTLKDASNTGSGGWTLRVEQGLNSPPDVAAVGPEGNSLRLTNLNPQYSDATWGNMRPYAWKDARGHTWEGGLMLPADFDPKVRYSLVIQTYGFSPSRFYLDGANLNDGTTSGFAGRAFLKEHILVLALPLRPAGQPFVNYHQRIQTFSDGVGGAIGSLIGNGLVDPGRIGIMGWSMTGEMVLNLVTFTDTPIRAASLLDGDANTLFSLAVTYAGGDNILARKEQTNEGAPFGEAMERWVRNDPAMHTDCIRAAMRIETYGPLVLNNWDIHALLRRQLKPAEMIVIPEGAHSLATPSERMISLQGNVDWYRFWLDGQERSNVFLPDETKASLEQQYVRWRQMAALKVADEQKPRCVLSKGGS